MFDEFQLKFATRHPTVPIVWENQKEPTKVNQPFVFVDLIPGVSRRKDLSRSIYEETGVINVTILVPVDTGTKTLNDLATTVRDILADREWSGETGKLVTYGLERRRRGASQGTYGHIVAVDYAYTEAISRIP
jgi:hypothetical protein